MGEGRPLHRILAAAAVLLLSVACSTGVTSPSDAINAPTPVTLLQTRYQFACSSWGPSGPPPVSRTVFDILLPVLPDGTPDPKAFAAIEAAGGRLVYVFHGGLLRVELDVAAIAALGQGPQFGVAYARNVRSLDDLVVPFFAEYRPPATDTDLVNLVSTGAFQLTITSFGTATYVGGFISDDHWPQLAALPIKSLGYNLPLLCAG